MSVAKQMSLKMNKYKAIWYFKIRFILHFQLHSAQE